MGRELQKRKNRSSRAKVRPPNRRKKQLNPQSNSIIAKNWNKKETMSQNYRRLGLVSRLGKASGGVEKHTAVAISAMEQQLGQRPAADSLTIKNTAQAVISEARVERDPATGRIVRVLEGAGAGGKKSRENPLGDPLNELESGSEDGLTSDEEEEAFDPATRQLLSSAPHPIVAQLEAQARVVTAPKKRHQSRREVEWLARLVAVHGDGDAALRNMARDAKLNPMQQTEADLRRRIGKWKEEGGGMQVDA